MGGVIRLLYDGSGWLRLKLVRVGLLYYIIFILFYGLVILF